MTQIKLRRDTAANFTSKNPVLGIGEPAYETDTKKLKIGDGTTAYAQLEYFSSGGGGSTNITTTLPLKIVDGVISLEVDGQTIQIVDGKLHANLDELGNEVNTLAGDVASVQADLLNKQDKSTAVTTDTAQNISGQKEFDKTILFLSNNDLIRAQQSTAYRNGAGLSMGANSTSTDGGSFAPQWKIYNTAGDVDRTETIITTYNQSKLSSTNFNTANKLVKLDSDGKLPAIDGSNLTNLPSGSAPTNMVTTDTIQTITGGKTFEHKIIFNNPVSDIAEQSSILGGEFKLGTPDQDNSIYASKLTLNANTTNIGTFKVQALESQFTQINAGTITSQKSNTGALKIMAATRPSGASVTKDYSVLYSKVDASYKHTLTINNLSSDLVLAGKTVKDGSGNNFLTSGDKETIMGYIMPDYTTRTAVPWNTDNTAPTDGYVEVCGEGDGDTSSYVLEYTLNDVKTAVSACYSPSRNTNFRLPVICPKGTVYRAKGGAIQHELYFISMKGAV